MSKDFTVQKLSINDANQIASVHNKVFKNFFLTSLGLNFLKNFYYAILKHEDGLGIGAFANGNLIGFAVGSIKTRGFYTSVLKTNFARLFLSAFSSLALHPSRIFRLFSSLKSNGDKEYIDLPILLSICVTGDHGMKGIGSTLIKKFEGELLRLHLSEVTLTTDALNNDSVNQFYIRNQYICKRSFYNGKRKMNFYYKKLKI